MPSYDLITAGHVQIKKFCTAGKAGKTAAHGKHGFGKAHAALAAKDETIAALRSQLADLRMQLVDKQNVIEAKDQLIDSLKMQINNMMSEMQLRGISTYPFEMGVAEKYSAPNKI